MKSFDLLNNFMKSFALMKKANFDLLKLDLLIRNLRYDVKRMNAFTCSLQGPGSIGSWQSDARLGKAVATSNISRGLAGAEGLQLDKHSDIESNLLPFPPHPE
jgi:hypothetical protein